MFVRFRYRFCPASNPRNCPSSIVGVFNYVSCFREHFSQNRGGGHTYIHTYIYIHTHIHIHTYIYIYLYILFGLEHNVFSRTPQEAKEHDLDLEMGKHVLDDVVGNRSYVCGAPVIDPDHPFHSVFVSMPSNSRSCSDRIEPLFYTA